jgi:hypothetical protein
MKPREQALVDAVSTTRESSSKHLCHGRPINTDISNALFILIYVIDSFTATPVTPAGTGTYRTPVLFAASSFMLLIVRWKQFPLKKLSTYQFPWIFCISTLDSERLDSIPQQFLDWTALTPQSL